MRRHKTSPDVDGEIGDHWKAREKPRFVHATATGPEEAVFIGDSRHDLESGRAAGVRTAAVLWGPFDRAHLEDLKPDYWLERPADLELL